MKHFHDMIISCQLGNLATPGFTEAALGCSKLAPQSKRRLQFLLEVLLAPMELFQAPMEAEEGISFVPRFLVFCSRPPPSATLQGPQLH